MRILIASAVDESAVAQLCSTHDVLLAVGASEEILRALIVDREALVFRSGVSITADLLSLAPQLKLIVRAGCGLDNIDLDYVRSRNIKLVTIPQPAATAVSEMAFALMLSLARKVREADQLWQRGKWAKNEIDGQLLYGKVLGVVGAGNIGKRVGQLGAAFGMKVLGCVEFPTSAIVADLNARNIDVVQFDQMVPRADFLSLHLPLSATTRHMINASVFERMKQGSFLINLARGGVVDEKALLAALLNGKLAGAALDVHEKEGNGNISPLAGLPNVLLTPHIGAMTSDTQRDIGQRVISIIDSFAAESRTSGSTSHTITKFAHAQEHDELSAGEQRSA